MGYSSRRINRFIPFFRLHLYFFSAGRYDSWHPVCPGLPYLCPEKHTGGKSKSGFSGGRAGLYIRCFRQYAGRGDFHLSFGQHVLLFTNAFLFGPFKSVSGVSFKPFFIKKEKSPCFLSPRAFCFCFHACPSLCS